MRTPATSEPASGSVIASAPIFSPRIAGASQRSCCSGVPNFAIGGVAMLVCAPIPAASPPDALRASSSANTASATQSASGPYFRPSQPRAAELPEHRVREPARGLPLVRVRAQLGLDEGPDLGPERRRGAP